MFYPNHIGALLVAALAFGPANAAPRNNVCNNRGHHNLLNAVWPPPQQISSTGSGVSLNGAVTIVTGNATDAATVNTIKAAVKSAGGRATLSSKPTGHGTQIFVGTEAENAAIAAVTEALTRNSTDGLAAEGYILASGKYRNQASIVLNGVDARGTFYASQTLRQLVDGHCFPGVMVRDWPLMPIRGSIEGFYGTPWSHQARLDQFVFYGEHKMNTYIYTPKNDVLLRANWRTLYSGDALSQLNELIVTANTNHVDFTFALSPGNDVCYSSDADFNATITKFDQVRELGVTSFYIALDDIPLEFHCDSDKQRWNDTGNWHWIADAQAYYLNRLQEEYIVPNSLNDLEVVPTNYAGSAPDPYKGEFGTMLNKDIRVQWTGEGVFSDTITIASVVQADSTYVTNNLYIWDNFPVNDGNTNQLFLNPLTGRDPNLYQYILGFTSNPMAEPYASMPALANFGDYTWNGPAYNANTSMAAVLSELAGSGRGVLDAVLAFSDLNQDWPYRTPEIYSPALDKDIAAFWDARKAKSKHHGTSALSSRLTLLASLPTVLPKMAMKGFASDVAPWSTLAMQWASACKHLIAMLDALDSGNKKKATTEYNAAQVWIAKTNATTVGTTDSDGNAFPNSIVPILGTNAFTTFLANSTTIYKGQ